MGTDAHQNEIWAQKILFMRVNADYMATAGKCRELYSLKTNYLQLGFAFMTKQQSRKEMNCHAAPTACPNALPCSLQPARCLCLLDNFTFLGPKISPDMRENAFNWGRVRGKANFKNNPSK